MEFQTDPNGDWQYCHSGLFGDLSALVFRLPYFEVRRIHGVDYVVLPPKVSRGFDNCAKFLDAEHVKVHGGRHYFANFLPDGERPADVPALCADVPALCGEKITVVKLLELLNKYPPEYKVCVFNPFTRDAQWVYADTVDHYGDNVYIM